MKTLPLILSLFVILTLASCGFDVATETTVYPDGSLDKTIVVEKDSGNFLFNVSTWEKSIIEKEKNSASVDSAKSIPKKEVDKFTSFHKKFNSVEEVNAELSVSNDTVLQVTSQFEKKFRWFYTYITYSETYHKLNTLKLPQEDYFTVEDYSFIDRLPAEGQKISKADERYLDLLNDKAFDEYGEKAVYEEVFELFFIVVNKGPDTDSLYKHKKDIDRLLPIIEDLEDQVLLAKLDSFNISIDPLKIPEFKKAGKDLERKIEFISLANAGKYVNRINLPWPVVKTNADSVSGNSLLWAPPTIKFLLKDYTMYGECRKLNWWAVIVSVLIVGFTGYLFVRKRN
jgi:hypothetical protein